MKNITNVATNYTSEWSLNIKPILVTRARILCPLDSVSYNYIPSRQTHCLSEPEAIVSHDTSNLINLSVTIESSSLKCCCPTNCVYMCLILHDDSF